MKVISVLKYIAGSLVPALYATVMLGCQPSGSAPGEGRSVTHEAFPYALTARSSDEALELSWKVNGAELMTGFQIYMATDSSQSETVKPFNTSPYPGDLDPTDGIVQFTAAPLPNGIPQFVWVKILFPDKQLSPASNIVRAVPYERDTVTLHIRFKDEHDGYSLARGEYSRANAAGNDLYFYSASDGDFLASPSRLDGFLRATTFVELPPMPDPEQALEMLPTFAMMPGDNKVAIKAGTVLAVRLSEGVVAIVQVLSVQGAGDDRTVTFGYISGIRPEHL